MAALASACSWAPTESTRFDPARAQALTLALLPAAVRDRNAWTTDLVAALSALQLPATTENLCSAIAVIGQESGFVTDPVVPRLAEIAWRQIDVRAARLHLPRAVVRAALAVRSGDGRSFAERIDAARTERELSDLYEEMIALVPLGSRLFADRNPVRTGGPMQVSIVFAQTFADEHLYPYPVERSIRNEVFTRRGGVFFGIAHLLAYPAEYDQPIFRFADFNAGRYASRNAAFQQALSRVSGVPLVADGDLLRGDEPQALSATERAARVFAAREGLSDAAVRRDLSLGREGEFAKTALYRAVFEQADELQGAAVARAAIPKIRLQSPKITRSLTTEWFARRVQTRYEDCMRRQPAT